VRQQLANRAGDGLADVRHLLQPVEAAIPKDLVQRLLLGPDARSRAEIRSNSESVGTLVLQQPGCLLKTSGHLLIDAVHHTSPLNGSSKQRSAVDGFPVVGPGQKSSHAWGILPSVLRVSNLVPQATCRGR
jgi:hypothetical protein